MSDSIQPINLAAIEQRATQKEARQTEATQESAKARLTEELEMGFNPGAVEREQSRASRFRRLETRKKQPTEEGRRVKEVGKKTEEDLAQGYNRRNPELPPDRLRALRDALRQGQTPEEVLKDVSREFPDATLADEALEYLEKETQGELKSNVRRARELLNELKGREVIAGRNVDTVAKSFHQKGIGQNPSELRELYRDITGNPRDHNTLFSELSNKYSFDQLKLVVAFLLKGLAFDLKSKGPSIQQAELMRLMTETRNLQSILWVYLFFKSRMRLIRSLYKAYGLDYEEILTFEMLAKQFIKLVEERYPSVLKLLKQLEKFGSLDDLEKIIVLMQYRDAVRQLSPRLYKSLRHRQDLLLVILEALEEMEERTAEEDEEE
ncbi:MAG: type III secretion system gatekeeper subunit SctW [Chlamydiales bacterium]|nr:type III secretion system gatekeeper subunit SctW [Chlamydiales bacterium]